MKSKNMVPSAPNFIDMNITNQCNMACRHCYIGKVTKPSFMNLRDCIDYIDQAAELGVFRISITGGEPLMHPQWLSIISHMISSGISPMINSNGTLFNDDNISQLANIAKKDLWIAISLDGMYPGHYTALRKWKNGKDATTAFDTIIRNVKIMIKEGFHVVFNFTYTRVNWEDLLPLYKFLEDTLGERNFTLNVILFGISGNGYVNENNLSVSFDCWKKDLQHIVLQKIEGKYQSIKFEPTCPWEIYLPLDGLQISTIEKTTGYISPLRNNIYRRYRNVCCHAGISNLVINWDGTVYPCGLYPQVTPLCAGNLHKNSLFQIWNESDLLKRLRNISISDLPETCQNCTSVDICGGGCRGAAVQLHNSLVGGDTRCPYYAQVYKK